MNGCLCTYTIVSLIHGFAFDGSSCPQSTMVWKQMTSRLMHCQELINSLTLHHGAHATCLAASHCVDIVSSHIIVQNGKYSKIF